MTIDAHGLEVLLDAAERAIEARLAGHRWEPDVTAAPIGLRAPGASFVTLERDGDLLGCIGTLEARAPLIADVARRAEAAAFEDPRFDGVTWDDWRHATVKVSVLSAPEPIGAGSWQALHDALRPGTDGVLVVAPLHRATFLPSVWAKVHTTAEFLDQLWRKAGLRPRAWPPGLRAFRYTTTEARRDPPPGGRRAATA